MRLLSFLLIACGTATGKVQIVVTPEDTITDGLQAGDAEENVRDGWAVHYDKFLITLGHFSAHSTDANKTLTDDAAYVLDLVRAGSNGVTVSEWARAPADIRFDVFGYAVLAASREARRAGNLSEADFNQMADNGYALYVQGTLTKASTTLRFAWGFKGATQYGTCGAVGVQPGFSVASQQTTTLAPTIHGDHWFFTSSPHATTPKRLAEWIHKCDSNGDGDVTLDELRAHADSELFSPVDGYNLSSLAVKPIRNGFDFFAAQARSLAHFQGDGECEGLDVLTRDPGER